MFTPFKCILKIFLIHAIFACFSIVYASAGLTAPQIKGSGSIMRIDAPGDLLVPFNGAGNLVKIGTGRITANPDNHTGRLSVLEGIFNINRSYPGPTSLSLNVPLAIGFSPALAAQLQATDIALSSFNALQLVPYDPSGADGIINIPIGIYRYPIIAANATSVQSTTLIVPDMPDITFLIQPSTTNAQWLDAVITTTANVAINTSTVVFKTIYLGVTNVDTVNLSILASDASRDAANAVIEAIGSVKSGSKSFHNTSEELRMKLQSLDKLPTKQKFEAILEEIARSNLESAEFISQDEQMRTWVMPYATYGKTSFSQFSDGSHRRTAGSLVGIEHRNLKENWAIGCFTGLVYTHENKLGDNMDWNHAKGYHAGVYGILKPNEHIRFESLLFMTRLNHKQQRHDNGITGEIFALSEYKQLDVVADNNVRFIHNVDGCWSVSTNVGYTYFNSKTDKYSEYNVSMVGINQPAVLTTSGEIYGGLGVRYNHKTADCTCGTIISYEVGREVKKYTSSISGTTQQGIDFFVTPNNRKRTSKYFTFFAYYEGNDHIKYLFKYSNISAPHDVTHNLMLKVEWKF